MRVHLAARYDLTTAVISDDGIYRYLLTRRWAWGGRTLVVIGLNPSTADADQDDPTIRRCVAFAKREQCGGLVMLNLYGLRSRAPAALRTHPDPVGPENDIEINRSVHAGDLVLAAWGSGAFDVARVRAVCEIVGPMHCLGFTKFGHHPRHPLYVTASAPLVRFEVRTPA